MSFEINAEIEAEALLKWKSTLYQPTSLSSWSLTNSTPHCKWYGILCNDDGSIVALELVRSSLVGTLDHLDFSSLRNLTILNLNSNQLYGAIPSNISTKLRYLLLRDNLFNGSVPLEIGDMINMVKLDLSGNRLTGIIPAEIGNMTSLCMLEMENNFFTGELPRSLSHLNNLYSLSVAANYLTGIIPSDLGKNGLMKFVDFSNNHFSEELPQTLCDNFTLQILEVTLNNLTGRLPSCLRYCSGLVTVSLDDNHFIGDLSEAFGVNPSIEFLTLSNNNFNGSIPESFCNMKKLKHLGLSDNSLSGFLPDCWSGLKDMAGLDLSHNRLFGEIPRSFGSMFSLETLFLDNNYLTGEVPSTLQNCKSLVGVNLEENELYGNIPSWFDSSSTPLIYSLELGSNNFNGSIPESICGLKNLVMLNLSGNHLIGNLPTYLTKMDDMSILDLSNNHFSGMIHSSFGSFPSLYVLHLNKNSFIGELPWSLQNCRNLVTLDLGENGFTGDIPTWFGTSFPSLRILSLRSNRLSGSIPTQLSLLASLQFLDLANNNLTGYIPTSFSHLVAMTRQEGNQTTYYTYSSGGILVEWHKRDQEFKSEVYLLNGIDLSNNSLSGQIPKELTLLSGLSLLNLSTNRLFGTIPETVDKLHSLESLDLSNNQLSGSIPPSMSSLSSLDFLNVSNNNLSGSIPKGTQLQTFEPSAYSGNMELCGAPLDKKCPTEKLSDHQASTQDNRSQNGDTEETVWFFLSVVLGIIVGFWVFCGILIFKKKWRIIYFQFIDNLQGEITHEGASISISDIRTWNIPSISSSCTVRIHATRSRLIEQSSYFRGLLAGSFSESGLDCVSIQWNVETVVAIMQFMYGCSLCITFHNFLSLMEGAFFFGVENLILECENWFRKISSSRSPRQFQISLDTILEIWNFGLEHGVDFLPELCRGYLARNFEWAASFKSFSNVPYNLLSSFVEHPHLTVDSEKQLCEALLHWLSSNTKYLEFSSAKIGDEYYDILKKVRICLLPLGFAAGQRRHFSEFACEAVHTILNLIEDYPSRLLRAIKDETSDNFRLRLTKYSEKVVLSGCAHITVPFLFLALLPYDLDAMSRTRMIRSLIELDRSTGNHYRITEKSFETLSFKAVLEVDISKCPQIHFGSAIKWLHVAFPSLRILKASHCLHFEVEDLYDLIQACPRVSEVDFTVDISPVILNKASILSTSSEECTLLDKRSYKLKEQSLPNIAEVVLGKSMLSDISKLTLEGRNEISDLDLLNISSLSDCLSYLNIRGCTLVSDAGISKLLCKCLKLDSLIMSFTSFGRISVLTLCSSNDAFSEDFAGDHQNHEHSYSMAFRLQQLQIDGCKGIDPSSMFQLLNHTYMLKIFSLRETCIVDDVLSGFKGSSLESLDVSETMVSMQSLTYVVRRNPGLRYLKTTDCRNLHPYECNTGLTVYEVLSELSHGCSLEEVAFGWGFSSLTLKRLGSAFGRLKAIKVGLGASLDHGAFYVLPKICPLLEYVILVFQVISDGVMENLLKSLKLLQSLELSCCLGELTSFGYGISMPNLRRLKLEWVTPWMTNSDIAILTKNCLNLVEFSLLGCKFLDADTLQIISYGWPGLSLIHLEECGEVTLNGVSSLFNLKAVEELVLRHNGRGIPRNFISDAASKMPLLRKIALDLCDACDGGFDSPSHSARFYLRSARISCCKSQRCGFELPSMKSLKPIHKETIVLEWNYQELITTMVKERI